MTVADFVEQWLGDPIQEHSYASSHEATSKELLYLKDWHFAKVLVRNFEFTLYLRGIMGQLRS